MLGPGRIGRQIALAFALGGCQVRLVDAKEGRAAGEAERTLADARREIARDVGLMVEEQVIDQAESVAVLARIEERIGLDALRGCGFVQEALPESVPLKQEPRSPGSRVWSTTTRSSPRGRPPSRPRTSATRSIARSAFSSRTG